MWCKCVWKRRREKEREGERERERERERELCLCNDSQMFLKSTRLCFIVVFHLF